MESENNYENHEGVYRQALKSGLFDINSDKPINGSELKLNHKMLIPLSRVNQYFFGTNLFSNKLNYFSLHRDKMIIKENGIYYVIISQLENYLNEVDEILGLNSTLNCCPYNYYKTFGKDQHIPTHYSQMINSIDKFLEYVDNKETLQARTFRHIISPFSTKNQYNKIETEVVDYLNFGSNQTTELLLKFNKKGYPLFIRMSMVDTDSENSLRISENISNLEFEKLYQYINTSLLMDNPEEFLITNIESVCGSREFAEIMVKSYLSKSEYKFSIGSISSIILWKNTKSETNFKTYFCEKYEKCFKIIEEEIYLNFEGINKFLLNISEDDVENFDVKEQINEMYYNSMYQMIYSFELLYKNK